MYTRLIRLAVALGAVALAGGCATEGGGGYYGGGEVPAGSVVELHERLELSGGSPRVYVQDGAVVHSGAIDRFRVSCSFGLERQDGEALVDVIEPDRFETVRPSRTWWRAEGPHRHGVQLAASGFISIGMLFEDDGPLDYIFFTELALRSERQPQVDDLTCRYDAAQYPQIARGSPTLEQINAALGDIATVRPAQATDG